MDELDRYKGCLLGLACGDAVGTTVEFRTRGQFALVTDMVGGGPFGLKPGQWTDDTSMALCLAVSLIQCGGFDARDQMNRYARWMKEGYLSSTGTCFDIGNTVRTALHVYLKTGEPYAGSTDPHTAGNGSLMRLAPVPLRYAQDLVQTEQLSAQSSRTTHAAQEAVDACRLFGVMLALAVRGESKETILFDSVSRLPVDQPLTAEIAKIGVGSYRHKAMRDIRGTGYVVQSLEAALWCFYTTDNYHDAILRATNLGDDADTTAAICGQIAGAHYGIGEIPTKWLDKLTQRDFIEKTAEALYRAQAV
jgi:ADP-ribosyl-[dinitrogen reductase] hydrolase